LEGETLKHPRPKSIMLIKRWKAKADEEDVPVELTRCPGRLSLFGFSMSSNN
jgi:hypothetical protein